MIGICEKIEPRKKIQVIRISKFLFLSREFQIAFAKIQCSLEIQRFFLRFAINMLNMIQEHLRSQY